MLVRKYPIVKYFLVFSFGLLLGLLLPTNKRITYVSNTEPQSPTEALEGYTIKDFNCRLAISDKNGRPFTDTLDEAVIYSIPEAPNVYLPTGNINDKNRLFDRSKGTDERPLFEYSDYPGGWDEKEIDIDGDGKAEKVMRAFLSMTRAPHLLRIVKDGYIVFEFVDQMVDAEIVNGKPGFLLTYDNDWLYGDGMAVRYVVEDSGLIKPVWQQRHCGLRYPDQNN